jgi:16S rRNA (uracil1498-N3)-methyltransferase
MKRYYCPDPENGVLNETESHHCLHVLRQKEGDFCTVFDGKGLEVKARLTSVHKKGVTFEKVASAHAPRPPHRVCLAQAVTKNRAMDLIIQKATELGVSEFAPLLSERCVPHLDDGDSEDRIHKWRQITIEAAKQSGNNWLPEIHPLRRPREFFEQDTARSIRLIASLQPEARPLKRTLRESLEPRTESALPRIVVMIGPEGDFVPAEIGEARARGFLPVSLGGIILRSETAALFTLSAVVYELAEG